MYATYTLDAPLLRQPLRQSSGLEAFVTNVNGRGDETQATIQVVAGQSSADETFATFEHSMRDDPTVTDWTAFNGSTDARQYLVTYAPKGGAETAYNASVKHRCMFLSATSKGRGWHCEILFPERGEFSEFVGECETNGMGVSIQSVQCEGTDVETVRYGLTEKQREAVQMAYERGYFSVPQETTLAALAEELGITSQALSGRLHRGIKNLIENTTSRSN